VKILHVITGLNTGGAEAVLFSLVSEQRDQSPVVISLTSLGNIGKNLIDTGVPVVALGLKFYNFPLIIYKLYKLIRQHNPTIVQTWLYHADFVGGLSARLARVRFIVWGIRTTELRKDSYLTAILRKVLALLSYSIPHKIIINSERGMERHIRLGYDTSKMTVVPNGFNIQKANVGSNLIDDLKKTLAINSNDFVIGCVGRLSQVKGQDVFIKSAGVILHSFPNIKFLMVGRGLVYDNPDVMSLIKETGSTDNFILLGERPDIPVCLKAMDVFCVPSRSEGFPNTLGEAMLAGLPCVSTDAGDASIIGGEDVCIANVNDFQDLAKKLLEIVNKSDEERQLIGQRLSNRIINEYSLEAMVIRFQDVYDNL